MTKPITYTATLTLSQEGLDGDVVSKLSFSPLLDVDADEVPACHDQMAHLVHYHLYTIGVVDRDGDLIDPDAFGGGTVVTRQGPLN